MGFDVGVVNIEYLERPGGIVYDFIVELAISYINCSGDETDFCFFSKEEIKDYAVDFLKDKESSQEQVNELEQWIEGLPWNKHGEINLTFNW